jgi:hypothetical protein
MYMMDEQKILALVAVSSAVLLVAGLIAIPAIEKVQAVVSRSDLDKQIREQVSKGTSGLNGLKASITSGVRDALGDHPPRPTG